jgi:hypothetical protein
MNEKLKWIEDEARANAAFHVASADVLAKEANTTLNLMLAGASGSLAYMVSLVERSGWVWSAAGMGAVSGYLFALAAVLVVKCLRIRKIWPAANEPENLIKSDLDLADLMTDQLASKQRCIIRNRDRNEEVSLWLNRCRVAVTATPLVFILAALVY